MQNMFHVTLPSRVDSILSAGLVPAIGRLSEMMGEAEAAVYLFVDGEALESALSNWMGEALDDEPALALLLVDVEGVDFVRIGPRAAFEACSTQVIDPSRVSVLSMNLDEIEDFTEFVDQLSSQRDDSSAQLGDTGCRLT